MTYLLLQVLQTGPQQTTEALETLPKLSRPLYGHTLMEILPHLQRKPVQVLLHSISMMRQMVQWVT
jgi:hypothetical protein